MSHYLVRAVNIRRRWRTMLGGLALFVALGVAIAGVAMAFFLQPWNRPSHSRTQLEHVLTVIGAPPGFGKPFVAPGGGLPGHSETVGRYYSGSGSAQDVLTWGINRLRSVGLSNAERQPPARFVTASCGDLEATVAYDQPVSQPEPTVLITIQAGSGRVDGAPDCPTELLGS